MLTPAGELLRDEIARLGPISFERFMDVALYHPEHGYYRRQRDPFGIEGDFYTAVQLQPVFGSLIRAVVESLGAGRTLVDIGAGRAEMREAFDDWNYIPIHPGDALPENVEGILFANELFDALPCRVFGDTGEVLVDFLGGRFVWTAEPRREECPRAAEMLKTMARSLCRGFALIIDYGYEQPEREFRFPRGSLMSYRRHRASEDVLDSPGERDITFHVDFTAVAAHAISAGFEIVRKEKLASLLLRAGEAAIQQAASLNAQQLKTLLFGMGEQFEALLLKRMEGV